MQRYGAQSILAPATPPKLTSTRPIFAEVGLGATLLKLTVHLLLQQIESMFAANENLF